MGTALSSLRTEMDHVFDRFLANFWCDGPQALPSGFLPAVDVAETESEVTVRAELPGMDPKDLSITLSGQVLTISGEKKESSKRQGENFVHAERRLGTFRRDIQLPAAVNGEKISAEHKNGVVFIRLPKDVRHAPKRIPVQCARD
jgi:HSP20 family protein